MFISRLRPFRIPVIVILLGLLGLSVICIRNIVTAAWQSNQQEEALYLKSPHCFPRQDPSEVDQSLPPCQDFMATVTAKPQTTVVSHRRSGDYSRTHFFLTLRYASGYSQTVGDIYSDMWYSIAVGSQVTVTVWRGQAREVAANGFSESIPDEKPWKRTEAALVPWIVLGLICVSSLSLLWRLTDVCRKQTSRET